MRQRTEEGMGFEKDQVQLDSSYFYVYVYVYTLFSIDWKISNHFFQGKELKEK